jgi:hypothetical protein
MFGAGDVRRWGRSALQGETFMRKPMAAVVALVAASVFDRTTRNKTKERRPVTLTWQARAAASRVSAS